MFSERSVSDKFIFIAQILSGQINFGLLKCHATTNIASWMLQFFLDWEAAAQTIPLIELMTEIPGLVKT